MEVYDSNLEVLTIGPGNAGNVIVSGYLGDKLTLEKDLINQPCDFIKLDNSSINTESFRSSNIFSNEKYGDAGNIIIATNNIILENNSLIESSSESNAKGGLVGIGKKLTFDKENKTVSINEPGDYIFLNNHSKITTESVLTISNKAGNIHLGANTIKLSNNSCITSSSKGYYNAGEIHINASVRFPLILKIPGGQNLYFSIRHPLCFKQQDYHKCSRWHWKWG